MSLAPGLPHHVMQGIPAPQAMPFQGTDGLFLHSVVLTVDRTWGVIQFPK
jgi:hypothetical protein